MQINYENRGYVSCEYSKKTTNMIYGNYFNIYRRKTTALISQFLYN